MNDFQAKFIKISAEYLDAKLAEVHRQKKNYKYKENKDERIFSKIYKRLMR